jgi:drug/metabolite transporter (DMT)-like permease
MTRRGWALFAAMCVIWGVPYLLIRVAVREFAPGTLVFARCALGGLLLLPFAGGRAGFAPVLRRWRPVLVFTVLELAVPWLALSDAERVLSSSLSGLLIAAVPLVGVVVAAVFGSDDRGGGWPRYTGLLLGVVGVGVLLGLDVGQTTTKALVEVAIVVVGYAVGPVIMARRLADLPSIPVVATCLLLTAVGYLPFAVTHWPRDVGGKAIWSVVALGSVCTALAFVVFFALIADIGPARATVITYVNPAVAVLLGVLLLNERFTAGIAVGFPLILLGSVLAARRAAPIDGVPEVAIAGPLCAEPADQSIRTSPDGVANRAATSPRSSSDGASQVTSTSSSG